MKNIELRKKALKAMTGGKPSIEIMKKKKGSLLSDTFEGEGEEAEKQEDMGMISMMVTPEEKEMIENMRGKLGGGEFNEEEGNPLEAGGLT